MATYQNFVGGAWVDGAAAAPERSPSLAPVSLAPGQSYAFDGGNVRYQVVQNSDFYGTEVRALKITLFEENVVLTLGQSAGRIFFR